MKAPKNETARIAPDIPENPEELEPGEIGDGRRLEDARAGVGDFSGKAFRLAARRSLIEGISFSGAQLRAAQLRDVRLVRCDLSNAVARGLQANRVEFIDCRLVGMNAIECRMEHVLMERCDLRYAQFTDGVAQTCEFIDAHLEEADFRATRLENTRWLRSSLDRADLTGAALVRADLRGASLAGILVRAADVAGAIVTPAQAMELARLLGLDIR